MNSIDPAQGKVRHKLSADDKSRRGNALAGSRGGRSLAFVEKVATHLPTAEERWALCAQLQRRAMQLSLRLGSRLTRWVLRCRPTRKLYRALTF